jgi:hypothetical protein
VQAPSTDCCVAPCSCQVRLIERLPEVTDQEGGSGQEGAKPAWLDALLKAMGDAGTPR